MKKITSLLLVLAMATLAMASCGEEAKSTDAVTNATSTGASTSASTDATTDASTAAATGAVTDAATAAATDAATQAAPADGDKGTVLYTIAFDEDDNGADDWTMGDNGGLSEIYVEGNILTAVVGGADPMMNYSYFEEDLDTEEITCISIKACNATNHDKGEFFYTTDGVGGPTAGASFLFTYANSGLENTTWETVNVYPEDFPDAIGWEGYLYALRYDVTDQGTEGKVMIESITFYSAN